MPRLKRYLPALAALAISAHAQEGPAITPYRPSVSTPAQLPAPGQLEFEFGNLSSRGTDPRTDSLPYTFKLAIDKDWGVLLGGSAYVRQRGAGQDANGIGDTALTLKRAFIVNDTTAYGLELTTKIPTAKDTIGSGKSDWTINAIYSHDAGDLHMDVNVNETRLGAPQPGAARIQTGVSASFSTPVTERWTANWELSGIANPGAPSTAQLLLAGVYMPSKRLEFDAGFTRGLTSATPHWSLFAGFVVPLAKLW
ncbi:hypothetical protein GCM10027321_37150 [Massilia terrae]|uniref:Transporter n=1 Tax=Massilia terrae TaxID=1811224 RepID=A0ABT2CZ96_9BURK|nr:transporter [Massilia terrae]MCS0659296.1 transporter [Massilia terrae]